MEQDQAKKIKRSCDWDFPLSDYLAESIDAYVDAIESNGATIPDYLSLGDLMDDILAATRDVSIEHELTIREYYGV